MKKQIILFAMAGFLATALFAQEQDSVKKLDEVVITATKDERNVYETGRSITVVTAQQIRESGALNIMDVLSATEGQSVIGTGQNYGSKSTLFLRGAAGNHTVVMIDGVRLSDPSSPDNGLDISEISLANIDRIEIVRGSHSTLYGSSAIGGVVNIITKGADSSGIHLDAHGLYGSFSGNSDWDGKDETGTVFDCRLNLSGHLKAGFFVNAGIVSNHSRGFNSTVDTVVTMGVYKSSRQADPYGKFGFNVKLGYKKKKLDVFASYRRESQESELDDGGFRDDDNHIIGSIRNLMTYGAAYRISEHFSVRFNGGYTMLERKLVDDSSLVDSNVYDQTFVENNYSGTSMNNDLVITGKWNGLTLSLGGNHSAETMTGNTYVYANSMWGAYEDSTDLDSLGLNTSILGFYTHADIEGSLFSEKCKDLTIGAGMRYNMHSRFGNVLTWEFAPGYKFSEKGIIYISFASGFNAPSMYQLFTPEKDFFSGIQRGNPDLKPETSLSFELGIRQRVSSGMQWSAAIFHTKVKNTIEYVYLWDGSKTIDSLTGFDYKADRYLNMGETRITGLEFSVQATLSEKLLLSFNMTVLGGRYLVDREETDTSGTYGHHVQIFSNGAFVEGKTEISGIPRRSSNGNVALTWKPGKKISVIPSIRYVSNRSDLVYDATLGPWGAQTSAGLGDYMLIDLGLVYEISKHLSIAARGENLSNQTYQEIRGYASRGRGFYLKLGAFF